MKIGMPVLTSVLHEFLGKAEVTASVHHIEKYKKSGIPINNFKALDTAGKKKKKREVGRKEEALQILCVMCFAQTQKFYNTHHARYKLLYLGKLKINLKNILENIFDLN